MSDVTTKLAARTVAGKSMGGTYRGWRIVNVSANWYQACKGSRRLSVGAMRHGDISELVERYHRVVDEHEAADASA